MAYDPGVATPDWVDEGPNLRPADGPTEAITIGTNVQFGAELFRLVGEGRVEGDFVVVGAGNHVTLDGTWDGSHLILGVSHLWRDALGRIRIKDGVPGSDTDGVILGQQS